MEAPVCTHEHAEDRIGRDGRFVSPELEGSFRRRNAGRDQSLARIIVCVTTLAIAGFATLDSELVPAGPARIGLRVARAAFVLVSVLFLLRLRSLTNPTHFDRTFGAWLLLTVAIQVHGGVVWPAGYTEARMANFLAILMSYCVMPQTLPRQTAIALLYTAGSVAVSGWLNPSGDFGAVVGDVCWFGIIHVLGVYLSYRNHVRQRLLYVAMIRQTELSARLARSLAEVRELRGLIRVCSWCRKVDAGTDWQQLEAYIRDHSHAEFTHGICPGCMETVTQDLAVAVGAK